MARPCRTELVWLHRLQNRSAGVKQVFEFGSVEGRFAVAARAKGCCDCHSQAVTGLVWLADRVEVGLEREGIVVREGVGFGPAGVGWRGRKGLGGTGGGDGEA